MLRKLCALATLSADDARVIGSLSLRREQHGPAEVIVREGDPAPRPRLMAAGWACRQRLLRNGSRQIFGLVLPGDRLSPGVCSEGRARTTIITLTGATSVDATPLVEQARRSPELDRAIAGAAAFEESLLLDHVVRLGRQTAYERLAHFLLELHARLTMAGVTDGRRFPLPLTQDVLADVLGLSIVHVNRTLQQLRRDRLVEISAAQVALLEPDRLIALADYRNSPLGSSPRGSPRA